MNYFCKSGRDLTGQDKKMNLAEFCVQFGSLFYKQNHLVLLKIPFDRQQNEVKGHSA